MKQIPLTQGKFALVDDEDYEYLNQFKWYALRHGNTYYAIRNLQSVNGKRTSLKMHRVILGITDPKILIDHKNKNGCDNTRNNLREASHSQNMANVSYRKKDSSSSYLGVNLSGSKYKGKRYSRWCAQITKDRVKYHLGHFLNEKEAAMAYNNAAIKLHGEFAKLNVI